MAEYPDENYLKKLNGYLEGFEWWCPKLLRLNVSIGGELVTNANWWCAGEAYPMGGCHSIIQIGSQTGTFQFFGRSRKFWFRDTNIPKGNANVALLDTTVAMLVAGEFIRLLNARKKFDPRTMTFEYPASFGVVTHK